MWAVPGESVHSSGGFRVGSSSTNVGGHDRPGCVLHSVGSDAGSHRGADVRDDVRWVVGCGRGGEGSGHAQTAADSADPSGRSSRRAARVAATRRRCRTATVKLFVFYLLVSVAFACLSFAAPEVADAAVVGFIALLLVPAVYAEYLRIRRSG
jgi:hypothetical protein